MVLYCQYLSKGKGNTLSMGQNRKTKGSLVPQESKESFREKEDR